MIKHHLNGNLGISRHNLDFIMADVPTCQGKPNLVLCQYSTNCNKSCPKVISESCRVYEFYKSKRYYKAG